MYLKGPNSMGPFFCLADDGIAIFINPNFFQLFNKKLTLTKITMHA